MAICLWCSCKLPKGRRKFCCNKHKDKYHNHHNPRGMFARLGGPSSGHDKDDSEFDPDDYMHPHDPTALGQWE